MLPKYHILFGAIFSILAYIVFNLTLLQASLIFFSSFLIDVDHYLWFVFKRKNLNLASSYKRFVRKRKEYIALSLEQRKQYKKAFMIFHGIEFITLLIILSFFYNIFFFILIGVLFHLIIDWIEMIYLKMPLRYKLSQIYVFIYDRHRKDFF